MPDVIATHRLTHAASLKMLQAGVAKANELNCKVSLAVVDQSCRLIGFLMMDGAHMARFAHLIAVVSMMLGCFVQVTRSGEEKASMKTCLSNGAE